MRTEADLSPRSLRSSEGRGWWYAIVAAGVICGIAMWAMVRVEFVNPDTAQHISVARNLLEGEGFSTSNIYYEEQYAARTLPAPQTLWPPGYPALVALASLIGLSALHAAFGVAIVAHVAVALLLFLLGRRTGAAPHVAGCMSLVWLLLAAPATLPLAAFTEPAFTALTLLAVLSLSGGVTAGDGRIPYRYLVLTAGAAAAAFSVRYVGIAFVGALGVFFLVRFFREPGVRRLLEGIVVAIFAGAPSAYLLWRNWVLTGSLTGGPQVSQGDTGLVLVLQHMLWSAATAVGVFGEHVLSHLTEGGLVLVAVGSLPPLARHLMQRAESVEDRRLQAVLGLAASYVAINSVMLITVALDRTHELIEWRYFVPLLPFALWAVGVAWMDYRIHASRRIRQVAGGALSGTIVLTLASQANVLREWDSRFVSAEAARRIAEAVQEDVQGDTLPAYLSGHASPKAPILAPDGQILGALVSNPTLSLPGPYFSSRLWTEAEVARVIAFYGVRWVVLIPPLFDAQSFKDSNRPFFAALEAEMPPSWLRLVHRSDRLWLYSVEDAGLELDDGSNDSGLRAR